jgi:hypothetical protein
MKNLLFLFLLFSVKCVSSEWITEYVSGDVYNIPPFHYTVENGICTKYEQTQIYCAHESYGSLKWGTNADIGLSCINNLYTTRSDCNCYNINMNPSSLCSGRCINIGIPNNNTISCVAHDDVTPDTLSNERCPYLHCICKRDQTDLLCNSVGDNVNLTINQPTDADSTDNYILSASSYTTPTPTLITLVVSVLICLGSY